ncbi:sulfur carrier protein ThiS [Pseudophaeobacter leonis]|uniref:sulfur carrier protein ThiS n=1 Tax=Pseudophaeobacter leonis TaxID=1144477 RepID=UPI0009F2BBF7|nr:sulfur carrier protein ThiS [Pseudophaeobacter leonis]
MKIQINAETHDIQSTTLDEALTELGMTSLALATAVNGTFVSRAKRKTFALCDGDRIDVLAPMQGG